MTERKLSKREYEIMEVLWDQGDSSIREIQERFPQEGRPAYTTIQTTVYRLEGKNIVRRVKKRGNFHIFAASVSRDVAQRKLIDDLLSLFGGRTEAVVAYLIQSGKMTLDDIKRAKAALRKRQRRRKQ
jgi:BlaI family penicillinase repressor